MQRHRDLHVRDLPFEPEATGPGLLTGAGAQRAVLAVTAARALRLRADLARRRRPFDPRSGQL